MDLRIITLLYLFVSSHLHLICLYLPIDSESLALYFEWDQSICRDLPSKLHDLMWVTFETDQSGASIRHPESRVSLILQYDQFMIVRHNWGRSRRSLNW